MLIEENFNGLVNKVTLLLGPLKCRCSIWFPSNRPKKYPNNISLRGQITLVLKVNDLGTKKTCFLADCNQAAPYMDSKAPPKRYHKMLVLGVK